MPASARINAVRKRTVTMRYYHHDNEQGDRVVLAAADWLDLERELDAWRAAGRSATLWWRDDDAVRPTPALDRLLAIAAGVPLALAVIPGPTGAPLAERLVSCPG